ncbi:hypothetical protein MMC25_008296 [Agyrium rufum]|nr:hypothetical protein [Agyrium rufum]
MDELNTAGNMTASTMTELTSGADSAGLLGVSGDSVYSTISHANFKTDAEQAQQPVAMVDEAAEPSVVDLSLPSLRSLIQGAEVPNIPEYDRRLSTIRDEFAHNYKLANPRAWREMMQRNLVPSNPAWAAAFLHVDLDPLKFVDMFPVTGCVLPPIPDEMAGFNLFTYFDSENSMELWTTCLTQMSKRSKWKEDEEMVSLNFATILSHLACIHEQYYLHQLLWKERRGFARRRQHKMCDMAKLKMTLLNSWLDETLPELRKRSPATSIRRSDQLSDEQFGLRRRVMNGVSRSTDSYPQASFPHADEDSDQSQQLVELDSPPEAGPMTAVGAIALHIFSFFASVSALRRDHERFTWRVFSQFLTKWSTLLVIYPLFIALSAIFVAIPISISGSSTSTSSASYSSWSQAVLQLLSLYCFVVPLLRDARHTKANAPQNSQNLTAHLPKMWLSVILSVGAIACILGAALINISSSTAMILAWIGNTMQAVATVLVIESVSGTHTETNSSDETATASEDGIELTAIDGVRHDV